MPLSIATSDDAVQTQRERRILTRQMGNAAAIVYRDTDVMRMGIRGKLLDISAAGLGITLREPLKQNEQIKIVLANEIQRVTKEVRGIVQHCTPTDEGTYRIGISLVVRLTPSDVSLLSKSCCLG